MRKPRTASIRRLLFMAMMALIAPATPAAQAEEAPGLSFLPDQHALLASHDVIEYPCRTEVSLSRDSARGGSYLSYLVGNDIAFASLSWGEGRRFVLGGMGFIRPEFELSSGAIALQGGDYQAGLCSTYQCPSLTLELSYYHVSSHYGDDYLRDNAASADDIGWEAFRLAVSLPEERELRPYAMAEAKTGWRPDAIDDRASLLGGIAWKVPLRALPAKLSAEAQLLFPDRDARFGIRLDCPLVSTRPARPEGRAFGQGLFLSWNRGPSQEGVFYGVMENRFAVGLSLTI